MTAAGRAVESVLGPVAPEELGLTLVHEHLFFSLAEYWRPDDDPDLAEARVSEDNVSQLRDSPFACRDNLVSEDASLIVEEASALRAAGGRTVVDVTPADMGRDLDGLVSVAERSGLHIVAATGHYVRRFHPPDLEAQSVQQISERMVRELSVGIADGGIRAGVIGEVGAESSPVDRVEERVLRAAARAQAESSVAIVAHPAPDSTTSPFEIVRILEEEGADLSRVVISHLDVRFRDAWHLHEELASFGVRLGFDTFGRDGFWAKTGRRHPEDRERIDALSFVLEAGLIDQVIVSQDICFKHELQRWGGRGYAHLLTSVLPELRRRGASEEDIDRITVHNPRVLLAGG